MDPAALRALLSYLAPKVRGPNPVPPSDEQNLDPSLLPRWNPLLQEAQDVEEGRYNTQQSVQGRVFGVPWDYEPPNWLTTGDYRPGVSAGGEENFTPLWLQQQIAQRDLGRRWRKPWSPIGRLSGTLD